MILPARALAAGKDMSCFSIIACNVTVETRFTGVSSAAERNSEPIFRILETVFSDRKTVLEIGSGTGQHATLMASRLPQLIWQPTDCAEYLVDLAAWVRRNGPGNIRAPLELDVRDDPWPVSSVDAVFSANTLHIMSWECVEFFFSGAGKVLEDDGVLCIYGPFSYSGRFTSDSNARFDEFLRQRDPHSGIRDFQAVSALAEEQGLSLLADHAMPANNQMLVWRRRGSRIQP